MSGPRARAPPGRALRTALCRRRRPACGSEAAAGRPDQARRVLLAQGAEHGLRVRLENGQRERLTSLDRPLYELPALAGGIDLGALYDLAERLDEQGMA